MTAVFVPQREKLVDNQGFITRPWYLFMQTLFGAGGGSDRLPPNLNQIQASIRALSATDAAFADQIGSIPVEAPVQFPDDPLTPPHMPVFVPLDDVLPVFNELRDRIAMLERAVDDLKKGPMA